MSDQGEIWVCFGWLQREYIDNGFLATRDDISFAGLWLISYNTSLRSLTFWCIWWRRDIRYCVEISIPSSQDRDRFKRSSSWGTSPRDRRWITGSREYDVARWWSQRPNLQWKDIRLSMQAWHSGALTSEVWADNVADNLYGMVSVGFVVVTNREVKGKKDTGVGK